MLNPFPSVPSKYWKLAMTYACHTYSVNPISRIDDSLYHFITGSHVDVNQLHPFFPRCYVFIPTSERDSKVGAPCAYKAHSIGYDHMSKLSRTYKVIKVCADGRYGKIRSSKGVIFDHSINFRSACPSDVPKIPVPQSHRTVDVWHDSCNSNYYVRPQHTITIQQQSWPTSITVSVISTTRCEVCQSRPPQVQYTRWNNRNRDNNSSNAADVRGLCRPW